VCAGGVLQCNTTKQNRTTFTYVGKETFYITNLFRKTELKIAFRTTNTIGKLLSHKNPNPNKFSLLGVYELTCPDCNKAYVGQTGRHFATRFKEHEKAFQNNSHTSSFAKHLNEEAHSFGPMNSIMQILHCHKKRIPSNSEIHDINTRNNYNLHLPTTNLILVQKGVLYSGSKIYNHLPPHIKAVSNDLKLFRSKLKTFLMEHTLYSLEEFYQVTSR